MPPKKTCEDPHLDEFAAEGSSGHQSDSDESGSGSCRNTATSALKRARAEPPGEGALVSTGAAPRDADGRAPGAVVKTEVDSQESGSNRFRKRKAAKAKARQEAGFKNRMRSEGKANVVPGTQVMAHGCGSPTAGVEINCLLADWRCVS